MVRSSRPKYIAVPPEMAPIGRLVEIMIGSRLRIGREVATIRIASGGPV
jgi:hypothetical protein